MLFEKANSVADARRNGAVGKRILEERDPYRLIGDQLLEKWREEEFADLYSREGKPGYSPMILAFMRIFQFIERLADRQAAHTLRMRMDWKMHCACR